MTNAAAQALGRLGRGHAKTLTDAERERRRQQAGAATAARMRKRGYTWSTDSERWERKPI
jgi:hypothetical protein